MIFATEAPKYWKVGLPVIPLLGEDKRPAILRWQLFAEVQPTEEQKEEFLAHYSAGNIGLPTGPAGGVVGIDIDTDDPKILEVLFSVLPKSPWTRRGKKGMMLAYQYNGERSSNIKAADGQMICEILSKGRQFVLPPSIHPETKRPYEANCDLYEVVRALPKLPDNVDGVIREALRAAGIEVGQATGGKITSYVPSGARDNAMTWHAGLLARAIMRGERTLIQALGEMEAWLDSFVEQVIGDPITPEKGRAKIIEFLIRDVTGERGQALPPGWDDGLTEEDKVSLGLSFTQDDEAWTVEKIQLYLQDAFERYPDIRSKDRMNAISVVLSKIARNNNTLNTLDESILIRFIAASSAGTIGQADLKRQIASLRKGDIEGDNHNELAEAALVHLGKYGELRYNANRFWQWKGAFWEHLEEHRILKIIAEQFGQYPACKRQNDHKGVLRVMEALAAKPLHQSGIQGLNFANGFLTENLELVDHSPDHGMTYILPYRYRPEIAGHMPRFSQFLLDSWADDPDYEDKVAALQEAMGVTLMSCANRYQRAFCTYGQPGSGKSRISAILRGLLPPNSVSSIPPQKWNDTFLPAQLFGKVLNFAGELSENQNIPGAAFKEIIEGTEITAQHKNQNPFEFTPTCAHWFSSNYLPKTRDSSDGFNRRWLIFEWTKRVPEHKRIPELDRIILEFETEAIVAWAIQGFERAKKNEGYTLPASHYALVEQMGQSNNSVRYFLMTSPRVVVGKLRTDEKVSTTTLHNEYWQFCLGTGTSHRVSLGNFQKMMKELAPTMGFSEEVVTGPKGHMEIYYNGIGIAS